MRGDGEADRLRVCVEFCLALLDYVLINNNQEHKMSKKVMPKDNKANQANRNLGTSGTNLQYDQAQGNRGKQLNPNQYSPASDDDEEEFMEYMGHELSEGDGI